MGGDLGHDTDRRGVDPVVLADASARPVRPVRGRPAMTEARPIRRVGDLSGLPSSAEGARHLIWWGNISFMLIEGTGFLLAIGAYLYLQSQSPHWPPQGDRLPDLGWSGIFTIGLVLSALPNHWLLRQTRAKDVRRVRIGILLMTLISLALTVVRGFEWRHLGVRWDHDAYGSVVWMLLLLHTTHVLTDLAENAVLTAWLYTHQVGDDQFCDVEDDVNYWNFVIIAWLPIYALLYWVPRWA
jgi:heme/copper-type cytochrome/quinol oxidase subunit 3